MSLLALSAVAVLVGVAITLFLVMRFVMKVVWKLAMFAALLVALTIVGVGGYFYLQNADLPELPSLGSPDR